MAGSGYKGLIGIAVAGSMLFSSTAAVAAAAPPSASQINPWAALTVMTGGAPAAAICGAAVVAATAQAPAGCVLPAVDTPPPVASAPPPAPIPVPPVEPAGAGLGIDPLLLALGVLAGGLALYFILRHKHGNGNSPA